MKQRQGKKAQRRRYKERNDSLVRQLTRARSTLAGDALEVNTARTFDAVIINLCKRPEYAKLAADIDEEMERLIEEKNIREVGGARRVRVD